MTGSPVTGIPPKTGNLYINPAYHKAKKKTALRKIIPKSRTAISLIKFILLYIIPQEISV